MLDMYPNDPDGWIHPVDKSQLHLAREFRDNIRGPHSEDLKRLLHRMRAGPQHRRYVLVVRVPFKEWVLGQLPETRGEPIAIHEDKVFTSPQDAEWEVFKLRWRELTGEELQV